MSIRGSFLFLVVIVVVGLIFWLGGFWKELSGGISLKPGESRNARVVKVIDGDTLVIQSGDRSETVRMIGIDTPESVRPGVPRECGSEKASRFMKRLAARRPIRLEEEPGENSKDRYGRTLAYVFPQGSSRTFQEEILEAGWADVYVFAGERFSKESEFNEARNLARDSKRGVWKLCDGDFHSAQ